MVMQYTKEDIDAYIEYSHILYVQVLQVFMPKVNLERADSKDLRAYGEAMGNSLGIQSIILQVYASMLEPFSAWMQHDCTLTKHKGMAMKPLKSASAYGTLPDPSWFTDMSLVSNGIPIGHKTEKRKPVRKNTRHVSDDDVVSHGGSKTSGIQEAIGWANAPGKRRARPDRSNKMTREMYHRFLLYSVGELPSQMRATARKILLAHEKELYEKYLYDVPEDEAVQGPEDLGKEMK